MANVALTAIATMSARGMVTPLNQIQLAAQRAGASIKGIGGGGTGRSSALYEIMVIMRELSRGNFSRLPGSISILLSRFNALKYVLNPLVILFGAVATGAFFVVRSFVRIAETERYLASVTDMTNKKLTDQADAFRNIKTELQSFADWLKKVENHEASVTDEVQEGLKAMRERAAFEKDLAREKGASPKEIAAMDLKDANQELQYVTTQKLMLRRALEQDEDAASAAAVAAKGYELSAGGRSAHHKAGTAGKILDAVQDAMETQTKTILDPDAMRRNAAMGIAGNTYKSVPLDKNDLINVEVDGKKLTLSLQQAADAFDKISAIDDEIASKQKEYNDLLNDKKQKTEKDVRELDELSKQTRELTDHRDNLLKYGDQIASNKHGQMVHGHVSSLQQIGAYTSGAVDIQHQQLRALNKIVHNTGHTGAGMGGGSAHIDAIHFGGAWSK